MNDRSRGPWIQTLSGQCWYPFDPRPEDVRFEDLRALSRISRYGGHTTCDHYSVAEHSVRVAWLLRDQGAPAIVCLAGLLHDAHEAYPPGDQMGPFLRAMQGNAAFAGLLEAECRAKLAVRTALGVSEVWGTDNGHAVKVADMTLLATERRDLMAASDVEWGSLPPPLPREIRPWGASKAWAMFSGTYAGIRTVVDP